MIKVSVIIPVYNVEGYLEKCLDSLVNQTLKEIEIILIDDGSTDRSLDIIKLYQKNYPEKIVYRSVENGGAASARNIALDIARGEYIGFVDSDDYVDLSMYEKLYNCACSEDADIVKCGYNRVDMDDRQRRDTRIRRCFGYSVLKAPAIYANNVPYIWNKLFKRSLIQEQQARFEKSLRIFEDLVFLYKLFLKANKIAQVPDALYTYTFSREGSLTNVFGEKRFDIFPAFRMLIDYFKEEDVYYHFEEELMYLLMNHLFVVFDNPIRYKELPLKIKYINQGFAFLTEKFPFWKHSNLYFEKSKKSRFLYTKKWYWYIKTIMPTALINNVRELRKLKKNLNFSKAGAQYYKCLKTTSVLENRVLILSQQGKNLSGNMFYILKELSTNLLYHNFEIAVVYAKECYDKFNNLMNEYGLNGENVKLIELHSKEYAQYLATAKYLFNDTSFSVYFMKRDEQVYLNTWHGTPLKTLGKGTAEDYYDIANVQKNFVNADYVLYPSYYMKNHMFRDYMMDPIFTNKVLMAGYPRNEIFFDCDRREQVRREQEMTGKTCIAYMPTWRGTVRGNKTKQKEEVMGYLMEMDKRLNEHQKMFVNLHPYLANDLSYDQFKNICPFPEKYETYDFLNACDMLITDYSSVMFDYAITDRKVILFAYDEEDYFKNRGVYVTLDELPFVKVTNVDELMDAVNDSKNPEYKEFFDVYAPYEAGDITKKICSKVILEQDSDLICEDYKGNKPDVLMIHMYSFANNTILPMKELCGNTDLTSKPYLYYTYDTEIMKNNKHMMKMLPEEMLYWGRLNPFSTMTLTEAVALYLSKRSRFWAGVFDEKLNILYEREKVRSFGSVDFKANIIVGKETPETIGYVSRQKGNKLMYLIDADDINYKVPEKVYNRFDKIIVGDENTRAILQQRGVTANILVMRPGDLRAIL